MLINKKGLINGVFVIIFLLLFLGIVALLVLKMSSHALEGFNNLTIVQEDPILMENVDKAFNFVDWFDRIIVLIMLALYVSYLISAVSISTEEPVYFLIFVFFLGLGTIFAMISSNVWVFMSDLSIFSDVVGLLSLTDFVLRFLPFISLIVGIIGAVLFYARRDGVRRGAGGVNLLE